MDVDEKSDPPTLPFVEIVDLDMEVESNPEMSQTEHVTSTKPDSKPEERITLRTLLTRPAPQETSNLAANIPKNFNQINQKRNEGNDKIMIPLHVKGKELPVAMVSEEEMVTLLQLKKEGVPIALSREYQPLIKPSQVKPNTQGSTRTTVDTSEEKAQLISANNVLPNYPDENTAKPKHMMKNDEIKEKGYTINGEEMVPLHVKGNGPKGTDQCKGPVVLISKEEMDTLIQKQKEGVMCTLSCLPQDPVEPLQADIESQLVMPNTRTLDADFETDQFMKEKNDLTTCEGTNAQSKTIAVSSPPVNVCTVVSPPAATCGNVPAFHTAPHFTVTSQNYTITTSENVISSNPGTPTGIQNPTYATLKNVASFNPGIPAGTNISEFMSLSDVITYHPGIPTGRRIAELVSLGDMMKKHPGISSGTQKSSTTTSSSVLNCNPVATLPGSEKSTVTKVNSKMQNTVVDLSYNFGVPRAPSSAPKTQNIEVLRQNSSACRPSFTARDTLQNTVITKRVISNRYKVGPTAVSAKFIAAKSNSPRNSNPNQPRFLIAKINGALANKVPLQSLKTSPSPFGRNLVMAEASQNGTPANPSLPHTAETRKKKLKTIVKKTVIRQTPLIPKQTREVIMPVVQQDGSVRLEKRRVPCSDKEAEENRVNQNQFTLSEVTNNPLESGVAKRFVLAPVNTVPSSSALLPPKTVQSTTSATVSTTSVTNSLLPPPPPSSLFLTKRIRGVHTQKPVGSGGSEKSGFQWHHPYSGDASRAAGAPEVSGNSETENVPVNISDSDDDDYFEPAVETSSPPPLANNENHSVMSMHFSSNAEEHSTKNFSSEMPLVDGIHSIAQSEVLGQSNSKLNCSNSGESQPLQFSQLLLWHQPCTFAEAPSGGVDSALIENSRPKIQNEAPSVKFKVKQGTKERNWCSTGSQWPRMKNVTTRKKKKNKKIKETKKDEKLQKKKRKKKKALIKTAPDPPLSARASSPSSGGSSFQWHRPIADTKAEKSADNSDVIRYSELKTEPISLPDSNEQQAQDPLLTDYEQKPAVTEDISETKYSPSSAAEASVDTEQDFPRIETGSIHSLTIRSGFSEGIPNSSCDTKEESPSSIVADDEKKKTCCHLKERKDAIALNKKKVTLKRRSKAKLEGSSSGCPTMSTPLKRVLVGDQDNPPKKISKKIGSSAHATENNQDNEQVGSVSKFKGDTIQKETSGEKAVDSSVIRDCVVRKTIQDCYSEGVIPTIDKIHAGCSDTGLESPRTSVEPHLISIGYNWVECKSQRVLVENHRFTAERMKYLNKLKKHQDKNLVYIFVSEYMKKNGNVWEVSPNDVKRPSRDSAQVVLHAMSNKRLLQGGLEVVKLGLFGLRRNDIISWLKCNVMPKIPEGSVVIFGHHPMFDKNEETEERPDFGYAKEKIVSWLTSHKVPSVKSDLPKALLLCKVNNVILPKTSIFDKLIRQNGFFPLHLPKHHRDLNPLEFIWRDILEKLYKTPDIIDVDKLKDFMAQEFSFCSPASSSVACHLVRKFECSYRQFDLCFDELFEKLIPVTGPVTDAPQVFDSGKKTTTASKYPQGKCPVCLSTKKLRGYRCSSCRSFWYKLRHDYKFRNQTGATLPLCQDVTHVGASLPDCLGCRRRRYELLLLQQVDIKKKCPRYVLPIPPVTELGKKHWSKKSKRRSKKSLTLTGIESQEDDEDH